LFFFQELIVLLKLEIKHALLRTFLFGKSLENPVWEIDKSFERGLSIECQLTFEWYCQPVVTTWWRTQGPELKTTGMSQGLGPNDMSLTRSPFCLDQTKNILDITFHGGLFIFIIT